MIRYRFGILVAVARGTTLPITVVRIARGLSADTLRRG